MKSLKRFLNVVLVVLLAMMVNTLAQAQVNGIVAVAWSPNGTKIAVGGTSGLLQIRDANNQLIRNFTGLTTTIKSVDWSPDSTKIVSGGDDGKVIVWDASTGQQLANLTGFEAYIFQVDWSPDGSKIVATGFNTSPSYTLIVWSAATYQQIAARDAGEALGVSWRPDSTQIAVGKATGYISWYSASLGPSVINYSIDAGVLSVAWSPDGSKIAGGTSIFGTAKNEVKIWNTTTGSVITTLTGHTNLVGAVAFSPNGQQLASASSDGTVRVWNVATGQQLTSFPKPATLTTSIAWSPDGTQLAYGNNSGNLEIDPAPPLATPTPTATSPSLCASTGGVFREYWNGISGYVVSDLTGNPAYPNSPTGSSVYTSFDGPHGFDDYINYGERWRGYLCPPSSGAYTFWIASDDASQLFLSTNSNPTNKTQIAYTNSWTSYLQWTKYASQQSAAITLSAGQPYYIEALHKQGDGGYNLSVAWQGPGIATRQVIAGQYLSASGFGGPSPTNTPTPTPTATRTPTSTPTRTPTPTITPTPGANDAIFADGFESGSFSAWSNNSNDVGDLSVTTTAAMVGTRGMQAVVDDNVSLWVRDDTPNAEKRYRARFYFKPNSISMATDDRFILLYGYAAADYNTGILQVEMRYSGSYQIRAGTVSDTSVWSLSNWLTISNAQHYLEFDWRAATAAGANDGVFTLWLDGIQIATFTSIDNDTRAIDRIHWGAASGIDSGTRGTLYFDDFVSRRFNSIGP